MSSISLRANVPLVPKHKSACQRVKEAITVVTGATVGIGLTALGGGVQNLLGTYVLKPGHGSYDPAESFNYGFVGSAILAVPLTAYSINKYWPQIRAKLDGNNAQANPADISENSGENPVAVAVSEENPVAVAVSEENPVNNPPPNRCGQGLVTLTNLSFPFLNGPLGYLITGTSDSIMNAGTVAAASAVGFPIFVAGGLGIACFVGACVGCCFVCLKPAPTHHFAYHDNA